MNSRVIFAFLLAVMVLLSPLLRRQHEAERLRECRSYQKNYGTALEMYSTDFLGRYPTSPALLVPGYLKTLPQCPTNDSDYYCVTASNPDVSTVICRGYHP